MMDFLFKYTPLAFFGQSFWRDEAFSYLMARQDIGQILATTARDFSPPLYYLILHVWMKVFGTGEVAIRSLSLVFFYATVYVIDHYLLDIMHLKGKRRYLYLLLFVINPFLIYYAYEARMYTMLAFFGTLSFYAYRTGKKKLHIVSSVLGLYTHYFMVLVLVSQLLFSYTYKELKGRLHWFVQIGVLFAPWVIYVLIAGTSAGDAFWIPRPTLNTLLTAPAIILTGYEEAFHLKNYSILPLSILICFSIFMTLFKSKLHGNGRKDVVYLLLWSFLPATLALITSFIKPVFLPRYFIFSSIGLTLLLVSAIRFSRPIVKKVLFVILCLLLLNYNNIQIKSRQKGDVRSVIGEIKKEIGPNDLIYVESELDFHTAQYYFDSKRVLVYRKTHQEIPSFVGKVLIPKAYVTSNLPIFPRKAYIIHRDLSYDVQSAN